MKRATIESYRRLTARIYPEIGHLKLTEIRVDHLNAFYSKLGSPGQNKLTGEALSSRSIIEHHRLISATLDQAVKEGILLLNVASRATLPKMERKEVNYFQPEQIAAIQSALQEEPVKWRMLVHMLMITGCRRGEILGLRWKDVDFEKNVVRICNNVLYSSEIGVYESTPKTQSSNRLIVLPAETMQMLKNYREWQEQERARLGSYYEDQGLLFARDNGKPLHPHQVTGWLSNFSKRHGLPHINAHAFRHTMASALLFHGVDVVSVAKRLGHNQTSTTLDVYSHILEEADQRNADVLADIFLKKD